MEVADVESAIRQHGFEPPAGETDPYVMLALIMITVGYHLKSLDEILEDPAPPFAAAYCESWFGEPTANFLMHLKGDDKRNVLWLKREFERLLVLVPGEPEASPIPSTPTGSVDVALPSRFWEVCFGCASAQAFQAQLDRPGKLDAWKLLGLKKEGTGVAASGAKEATATNEELLEVAKQCAKILDGVVKSNDYFDRALDSLRVFKDVDETVGARTKVRSVSFVIVEIEFTRHTLSRVLYKTITMITLRFYSFFFCTFGLTALRRHFTKLPSSLAWRYRPMMAGMRVRSYSMRWSKAKRSRHSASPH